jgi:hypothetical protein
MSGGYAYRMCSNKARYCLKGLPDCQKGLPREERLAAKNQKNAAKFRGISHGKGMLPICDHGKVF